MKNVRLPSGYVKVDKNRYEKERDFNLGSLTKDQQWRLLREEIKDLSHAGRDRDLARVKFFLKEVKQIVEEMEK